MCVIRVCVCAPVLGLSSVIVVWSIMTFSARHDVCVFVCVCVCMCKCDVSSLLIHYNHNHC